MNRQNYTIIKNIKILHLALNKSKSNTHSVVLKKQIAKSEQAT